MWVAHHAVRSSHINGSCLTKLHLFKLKDWLLYFHSETKVFVIIYTPSQKRVKILALQKDYTVIAIVCQSEMFDSKCSAPGPDGGTHDVAIATTCIHITTHPAAFNPIADFPIWASRKPTVVNLQLKERFEVRSLCCWKHIKPNLVFIPQGFHGYVLVKPGGIHANPNRILKGVPYFLHFFTSFISINAFEDGSPTK
jgi:hypothetical protein